jgi:long-chain acyl-CoA synthetase
MLYEMFRRTATRHPDTLAVVGEDGTSLTFAELRVAADTFAETLVAAGVSPGEHVVVVLPNTPAFVVSALAIARAKAVLVPLNPAYQEPELRYYLRECRAVAVVTEAQQAASCERVQRALNLPPRVFTDVGGRHSASAAGLDPVDGSAPALCQYSSGSTGLPKPIVRTHAQLIAEAEHFGATVGLQAGERILTVVPLFHAHGFGNCLLAAAHAGATLVLLTAFHRRRVIASIKEYRAAVFPGVPFMFGILASSGSIAAQPFPDLRLAFSAGAALPRDVFSNFREKFRIEVRQLYGSTETGSVTINLGDCDGERWASVGRPMRDVELRIVDAWGRVLGPGERGEILVRSAAMASAYRGLDAATAAAFRDGFYWTSDLGYRDDEGDLFLTGRTTIFIDTGGHKVDPVEVEQVLDSHPKIAQSVVVGVKGRYGRQVVKAVIVAREPCTAEEIAAWCRGRLADFKIPRVLEFRREIPVSPLGKILRKYLQDLG